MFGNARADISEFEENIFDRYEDSSNRDPIIGTLHALVKSCRPRLTAGVYGVPWLVHLRSHPGPPGAWLTVSPHTVAKLAEHGLERRIVGTQDPE